VGRLDCPYAVSMSEEMQPRHVDGPVSIRWFWVAVCLISGCALIGLALILEFRWGWQGVMPSVLVDLGAAIGLAGILYLLEQRFEGRIIEASEKKVVEAVQGVEERLQERTDRLAARLDELQPQLVDRLKDRRRKQDHVLDVFGEDATFESISAAFGLAFQLGALHNDGVTVQADEDIDGTLIKFSWTANKYDGWVSKLGPHVEISVVRLATDSAGGISHRWGPALTRTRWLPNSTAVEVGENLVTALQKNGQWTGEAMLDWSLTLRNLQRAMKISIASRRADPGAWRLRGRLRAVIDDRWVLTDAGLEAPGKDYMVPAGDFKEKRPLIGDDDGFPERPEWEDEDHWKRVTSRAIREYLTPPV
jgi:hypothetical protein